MRILNAILIIILLTWVIAETCMYLVNERYKLEMLGLQEKLEAKARRLDSCYESAQKFRDDWFECQLQKGFASRENSK